MIWIAVIVLFLTMITFIGRFERLEQEVKRLRVEIEGLNRPS